MDEARGLWPELCCPLLQQLLNSCLCNREDFASLQCSKGRTLLPPHPHPPHPPRTPCTAGAAQPWLLAPPRLSSIRTDCTSSFGGESGNAELHGLRKDFEAPTGGCTWQPSSRHASDCEWKLRTRPPAQVPKPPACCASLPGPIWWSPTQLCLLYEQCLVPPC